MPFGIRKQTIRPSNTDLGLAAINKTYDQMGIDAEWTVWEPRGFTWWGWHSAQRVWSETGVDDRGHTLFRLHARAELFDGFDNSDKHVELLNFLGRTATLSGIVVCTDRPGRIEMATSVYVHEGNFAWAQDLFSTAVAMQAAEAAIRAEYLHSEGGLRRVSSAHPHSGPRAEMDEMLDVFKHLVNPEGQDHSRYTGEEMEQLVATLRRLPCVEASSGKFGLAAEFPYPGRTLLLHLDTTQKHPRAGNGLFVSLNIPEGKHDVATMRKALEWNKRELSSSTAWTNFLGSWWCSETGLNYVSFYPNLQYRKGCLPDIAIKQVVRARWVTEQVMGYSWDEHFEEALKRKMCFGSVGAISDVSREDICLLYPLQQEGTRRAAKELGVDPNQVQVDIWHLTETSCR